MQTLTANAAEIEIRGGLYAVEAIPAGEFGVSAVRVTKLVNGESYDVIRTHANVVECTCPDFVCRHEGKGTMCKHGRAAVVEGLLPAAPAPVSGGSPVADLAPPAAVRPVTPADLKRAAYFKLAIPKPAPVEVPEFVPEPSAPAPALEAAPEVPAANPRDSWPDWTDSDRWAITEPSEAPALAADDETACPLPSPVVTMPDLGGLVVADPASLGLPPALDPLRWVEIGPRVYTLRNITADRVDYPGAARRSPFVPTAEEQAEAAALFADSRSSCLAGESSPPIGDRGVPRRATAWPRRTFDEPREHDGYPAGYTS